MSQERCDTTGKLKYPTTQAAHRVIRRSKKRRTTKPGCSPYKCKYCKAYHITSQREARDDTWR